MLYAYILYSILKDDDMFYENCINQCEILICKSTNNHQKYSMLFPLQNETPYPYLPISLCAVEKGAAAEEVALQTPSAVTKSDPLLRLLKILEDADTIGICC